MILTLEELYSAISCSIETEYVACGLGVTQVGHWIPSEIIWCSMIIHNSRDIDPGGNKTSP